MWGKFSKKAIIGAIIWILCLSMPASILAVENNLTVLEQQEEEKEVLNPERKKGEKPALGEGEVGVLVDSASGRVLFEKDCDKRMYPASTTKIMTALVAIEAIERGEFSLDSLVTITSDMLANADPDGSNIALKEGEIISLDNLLKGLMIPSGNDAASAIAIYIGGSLEAFVDKMNARAIEIGAKDTHFVNPHGLHDDEHYTTARDMAKISCAAMKLFKFRDIVDIAHVKIPPTNMTETERYYINTNGLLSAMRYSQFFYKGTIGIKTGYTQKAGSCLVSAATRDGVELIGVIFGGKETADSHYDSREMLDWGFENYISTVAVSKNDMVSEIKVKQGRGRDVATLMAKENIKVVAEKTADLSKIELVSEIPDAVYAPVKIGDSIGTVKVMLDGEEIGRGELVASNEIKRSIFWPIMAFGEWLWSFIFIRIIVYIVLGVFAGFVGLFLIGIYRNIKMSKRRKRRMKR